MLLRNMRNGPCTPKVMLFGNVKAYQGSSHVSICYLSVCHTSSAVVNTYVLRIFLFCYFKTGSILHELLPGD